MSAKLHLTILECADAAASIAKKLPEFTHGKSLLVWGIPRGGISAAMLLINAINHYGKSFASVAHSIHDADIICDDVLDSGATMARVINHLDDRFLTKPVFASLFAKSRPLDNDPTQNVVVVPPESQQAFSAVIFGGIAQDWLVFPWEVSFNQEGSDTSAHDAITRLLQFMGEDPKREGLLDTPKRVLKAYDEWFAGYHKDPADLMKTFDDGAEGVDEMVLLTDIPVWSHCEHHMTPFFGVAHVAYIPDGKIIGLSKIAKVVDLFSRRLQVQERLTNQIADCFVEHLQPLGVAVVVKAQHLCMCSRGAKTPNVWTTTSALRGVFKEKPEARAEFMGLLPK